MYKNKKVLLIAGGGTLGTYTANELLRLGAEVEVICPEEKISDHPRLKFHQSLATEEFLAELFSKTHYDGIVNFIHFDDPKKYKKVHRFLIKNTDHLVFLSSYRVYADEQHPVTEDAPRLYDVVKDREFLETEDYAVPKSICEDFLRTEHGDEPWTIVRPVISFSHRRLDLLLYSGTDVLDYTEAGRPLPLPTSVRDYSACFDWAGNSGKLIASLLFRKGTHGNTYTVSSGHGLTWGEVAEIYHELTGVTVEWVSDEEFVAGSEKIRSNPWIWKYDRIFNRDVDVSAILTATGLTKDDFTSVRDGILIELENLERENASKA
jgi:nucleoside-diphosphate-sugar epimerase